LQPGQLSGKSAKPIRNVYQLRAYAAQRAMIAIDRFSRSTSPILIQDHVRAFRWMKLWMDFATRKSDDDKRLKI